MTYIFDLFHILNKSGGDDDDDDDDDNFTSISQFKEVSKAPKLMENDCSEWILLSNIFRMGKRFLPQID